MGKSSEIYISLLEGRADICGFCPYLHCTGFLEYANNTLYFDSVKVVKFFHCRRENSCLGIKIINFKILDIIN